MVKDSLTYIEKPSNNSTMASLPMPKIYLIINHLSSNLTNENKKNHSGIRDQSESF